MSTPAGPALLHTQQTIARIPLGRFALPLGLLLAVALAIVGGLTAGETLWRSVALGFTPSLLLALLPLAVWSFGLRVLRWHVLLSRLVPGVRLSVSAYSQLVGFGLAATPGRIAELYKLKVVEDATGLPVGRGLAALLAERLTDVVTFVSLVAIGGGLDWLAADPNRLAHWELIVGVALASAGVYFAGWRRLLNPGQRAAAGRLVVRIGRRVLERLPAGRRFREGFAQFRGGATEMLSAPTLCLALTCVVLGRLGDAVVVWSVASALGYPVQFAVAVLVVGAAGLAGGLSLSPGGLGVAEATLAGLIATHGVPLGPALTITLVNRTMVFWLWVVLGLLALLPNLVRQTIGRRELVQVPLLVDPARPSGPRP